MKILVVSDNHGLEQELQEILETHSVDHLIHCGDSEFPIDHPLLDKFIKVKGNCDRDKSFPDDAELQLDQIKLYITHGHLYGVKSDLLSLSYRAQEVDAQIICYGHSHIAHAEIIDRRLYINPGSIRNSKSQLPETYVILTIDELDTDQHTIQVMVEFYALDHSVVKSDTFTLDI